MNGPTLEQYLRLLNIYGDALRKPTEARGTRFELVFGQVLRLIVQGSPFNSTLPLPFRDVAERFIEGDKATVEHFSYDENRQFFLSDLYDYLQLQRSKSRQ